MSRSFHQFSDTAALQEVIVGRYKGYAEAEEYIEIVNEEQKKGLPDIGLLEKEFEQFIAVLQQHEIEVRVPDAVAPFVYDQLTPRDIGITIGNQFLLCNMVKKSRRYEAAGIFKIINKMDGKKPAVVIPPENDMLIEGGDVVLDHDKIFVGVSQRTNQKGFDFLEQTFADDFELIKLECQSLEEGENVLHLDCTFNRIGTDKALIYPPGFKKIPEEIMKYDLIEVNDEEQSLLGTNVLSLNESTIISRKHTKLDNLNDRIRNRGIDVIELPFDGACATGGSFRCCTLPLIRKS